MGPYGLTFAGYKRIPLSHPLVYHLIEDKTVNTLIGAEIIRIFEQQKGVEHPDKHFSLLPEFLFHVRDSAGIRTFDKYAAKFPVDAVPDCVFKDCFKNIPVILRGNLKDFKSVE